MKEQDKQLLLTDLCARLPYGVKVNATTPKGEKAGTIVTITTKFIHLYQDFKIFGEFYADDDYECFWLDFGLFKSYLRPMSSMTEEEKEYIKHRWCYEDWPNVFDFLNHYQIDAGDATHFTDWLNEHHFDYRGLINKSLALEAPEGMYKTE